MRAAGRTDPRAQALKLMARLSYPSLYDPVAENLGLPQRQYDLLAAYYDYASPVIDLMTELGALSPYIYCGSNFSRPTLRSDYFSDLPENAAPWARARQCAAQRTGLARVHAYARHHQLARGAGRHH